MKIHCFNYERNQYYVQDNKHYKFDFKNLNRWHKLLVDDEYNSNVYSKHIKYEFAFITFKNIKKKFDESSDKTISIIIKDFKNIIDQLIELQMFQTNKSISMFNNSSNKRFHHFFELRRHKRRLKKFNLNYFEYFKFVTSRKVYTSSSSLLKRSQTFIIVFSITRFKVFSILLNVFMSRNNLIKSTKKR